MNPQLENILISTLEKAQEVGGNIYDATKEGVTKAVDFAQEQIPDVIAQIIKWEFAYHVTFAAFWLLVAIGLVITACYFLRRGRKAGAYNNEGWYIGAVISGLLAALVFFGNVPTNAMTATKIAVAPKVFFIDYCSDLISAHRKEQVKLFNGRIIEYKRKHGH